MTTTLHASFTPLEPAAIAADFTLLSALPRAVDVAEMLGVPETRISKAIPKVVPGFDKSSYRRGRDLHLPPHVVLAVAMYVKERPISETAARLVSFAVDHAPQHAELVDDAIEHWFAPAESAAADPTPAVAEFLDAVRDDVAPETYEHLLEVARRTGAIS